MADIGASNWSETDASNTTAAPDGAPEGMAPSGVNDVLRAHQGAIKRWYDWTIPKATGGTSTAYTLSYTVAPGALVDGMTHLVKFNAVNGANPTLNVNSLGAKPLTFYCGGSWSTTNTMPPYMLGVDQVVEVTYDSSSGTYRCIGLPLVLRQTVSAASTLDFSGLPTNVNALQLSAQFTTSVNGTAMGLRTFASGGSANTGGSDYAYTTISWFGTISSVASTTASSISFGSVDTGSSTTIDAVAAACQSRPQFNYGYQNTGSAQYGGARGVALAPVSFSGIRLLPGSGTITGTATLTLS